MCLDELRGIYYLLINTIRYGNSDRRNRIKSFCYFSSISENTSENNPFFRFFDVGIFLAHCDCARLAAEPYG